MAFEIINENDSVCVDLETGRKIALKSIKKGESVIKYGFPIGVAACDIQKGEEVHTHNLKSALTGRAELTFRPSEPKIKRVGEKAYISAFQRRNGEIGIRNDIWIIPTVGCVNETARELARRTGAAALTYPYGCSQLGDDLLRTRKIICSLITHPNAGGVLVLGLGCENNNIDELKNYLGEYDSQRVLFLNAQDCSDELKEGERLISALSCAAKREKRTAVPLDRLRVGLKCGGSDAFSGITANPMCGRAADSLALRGVSFVMGEVPEMFGAEELLLSRCQSMEVFLRAASLINGWREYFVSHGQPVSENPSPGNKAGGITTLEEKSLGCVQKGGTMPISDVIGYGETAKGEYLTLVSAPGNDMVSSTALAAAHCHMIIFTTGRGTPFGSVVPTVKLSSNTALFEKKPSWIDYDAQSGSDEELISLILRVAEGEKTKNEINGFAQIALFKDGVTL